MADESDSKDSFFGDAVIEGLAKLLALGIIVLAAGRLEKLPPPVKRRVPRKSKISPAKAQSRRS